MTGVAKTDAPIYVIVNAAAHSDGAADVASELGRAFEAAAVRVDLTLVQAGGSVGDEVRAAIGRKPAMIVIGGGDGTINAAASVLVGSGIAMGVLPLGTLNHFARDLHIPQELEQAVAVIAEGYCAPVDVGAVNDRYFLNNASIGIYPRLVKDREQQQQRLGRGKWPAFAWAALALLRRYPFVEVMLDVDGQSMARKTPFVFVGNNRYQMEGFTIGERASLAGGELSLYVANRTGRLGLVRLALRALFRHLNQATDFDAACARQIDVRSRRARMHVATDGEIHVMDTPLRFRSMPAALMVVVPRPPAVEPG